MSLNQIIFKNPSDTIDSTLNLKANSIEVKGNINVPFINGMPYVGGSVNVGSPFDLLQTNSTGTAPEWTSDISVDDVIINGDIILNGSAGTNNQAIIKSGGNPVWGNPTISLSSIPSGTNNTVLITDGTGTVDWSRDIDVDTINIDGQIELLNDPGTDGEVIIKSGGLPTWGLPTIVLPSFPVGTPRQILQTNQAGTQAQWTSNIDVVNQNISGNLTLNSSSGASGNVPVKVGTGQVWGKIGTSSINSGPASTLLYSDGTNVSWTNSNITLNSPNVTGNLLLNGGTGSNGQFIKKTGSSQGWANLTSNDLTPGLANQALLTNGSGTGCLWGYVTENSIQPNTSLAKQVLTVNNSNTSALWSFVNPDSIEPGTNGQILATNGGTVQWEDPVSPIVSGLPYQLLQTNSAGSAVQWTGSIRPTSILFNSVNNTLFNRYYNSGFTNLPLVAYHISGDTFTVIGGVSVEYTVIGNVATIIITNIDVASPNASLINLGSYYFLINITAPLLLPRAVVAPSNYKQTSQMCSVIQYTAIETTNCSVYRQYYSHSTPYIEFTAGITAYNENGSHGTPFVYVSALPGYVFQFQSRISLQYLVD